MNGTSILDAGLVDLNVGAPAGAAALLDRFLALIAKWNKVHNLTAILEPARMIVEHALDSLAVVNLIRPAAILDVGSGAGLPGIPLAIARPQWHFTLLDSSQKRCAFLRQAVIELGVHNVSVVCARIEAYSPPTAFDTILSRAFSETDVFARGAAHLLRDDGIMLAMKGQYPEKELRQLPEIVHLREVIELHVPGLAARRHAVIMTRA